MTRKKESVGKIKFIEDFRDYEISGHGNLE